jgi:hypothetical protein
VNISELTGPVIHIGVSAILALIFRLNLAVAIFCGILPDIVDKPLAAMGIGSGRYIGHTLLFAVVVSAAFFFWKKKYGLAAVIGLVSHLLLDLNTLVPWFYPFKSYNFGSVKLDFTVWLHDYLSFDKLGHELIAMAAAVIIVFIGWRLYRRYIRHKKLCK